MAEISNSTANSLVVGTSSDDFIYNYDGDGSTLSGGSSVPGNYYSSQTSGDDVIITVGDASVTLVGAASLSAVNIDGTKLEKTSWTFTDTTAIYLTSDNAVISVDGVKSLDDISLNGSTVTVSDASLNKKNVTVSDGYTLKLAKDVTKPSTTKVWSRNKTTATYKQTKTAGYTLADNAITYNKKSFDTLATVKGVKSTAGLSVKGKVITLKASAINKKVTVDGSGYEFNFAAGNYNGASISGFDDKDTLTFDNLDFQTSYSKKNNAVTFKFADGSVTLKDFTATTFHVNNDVYKISNGKFKIY